MKYKVIFHDQSTGRYFLSSTIHRVGFFFPPRVQSQAFQRMLLYKKLIIHMEEPGSQNNVDSVSVQNMNCLTYSHLRRGLFSYKTVFLGEVGKQHS